MSQNKWVHEVPVWASRECAKGQGYLTLPLWLFLTLILMALLNIVLWLGIGLVEAVQVIL